MAKRHHEESQEDSAATFCSPTCSTGNSPFISLLLPAFLRVGTWNPQKECKELKNSHSQLHSG